jgi:CRISPR system Cascade subunit CasE
MTLHMLQMQPEMGQLVRWAEARHLLPRRGEDDLGYALHALLTAAFGELAPKPFALRRDPARPATLLAYSARNPVELREHAATFADPDVVAALQLDRMAIKAMPESFAVGRRLGFSLRVRPTVRTDRDGDRNRVREVDAFLAAVQGTPPGAGPDRGTVYQTWLADRLTTGGAVAEQLTLDAFQLSDVQRRGRDRSLGLRRGPDAVFSGVLRVTDPEVFIGLLTRGVGRHRAFGYGMLLLRPV